MEGANPNEPDTQFAFVRYVVRRAADDTGGSLREFIKPEVLGAWSLQTEAHGREVNDSDLRTGQCTGLK